VTRARGNVLQNALAAYLARWWVNAESVGAGRQGTDVTGTPGVVWECKTASEFKRDFRPAQWVEQAKNHSLCDCKIMCAPGCDGDSGAVPVVVYFPPGIGAARTEHAMAIMPMHVLMRLLTEAQYTPATQETAAP
jgi:hypothetical protein